MNHFRSSRNMISKFYILGFICVLVACSSSYGQILEMWEVHPLSLGDLDTLGGRKYDPQFAPNDKSWISFEADNDQRRTLFLLDMKSNLRYELGMNPDTSVSRPFIDADELPAHTGYSAGLAWCPVLWDNQQWFAFVGSTGSNQDIYLSNIADLPKIYRITSNPAIDDYPVWSPDGRRLIFVSRRTGKSDVYLIANVEDLLKRLQEEGREAKRNIGKNVIDEKEWITRFTDDPDEEIFPAWSRDGKYLVYTIMRTDDQGYLNSELVVKEYLTGKVVKLLTERSHILRNPSFSPDGRYIALYEGGVRTDETVNLFVLQVVRESGKIVAVKDKWSSENVSKFKDVKSRVHGGPYWSTDGSLFFLTDRRSERNTLLKIDENSFHNLRRPIIQRYFLFGQGGINYNIRDFDFSSEELDAEEIIFSAQQGNKFAIDTNLEENTEINTPLLIGGIAVLAVLVGVTLSQVH